MIISSPPISLRPWQESDLADLVKYANNFNIWINLRDAFPHPYTIKSGKEWLDMALKEDRNLLLAITWHDELVGGIGAMFKEDVYRINCEIGYWLAEPFWGKGIMTKAVTLLTDNIFSNYPEILRIYADVFSSNAGSTRVLEKCGFHLEAVHKRSVLKNGVVMDEKRCVKMKARID